MTKQIVPKRTQAILSLSSGLQVQNHELVQSEAFTEFLTLQSSLQQQIDDGWKVLQDLMKSQGVQEIKGGWGTIRFESAELLVIADAKLLDPGVTKPALDTKKVRAYRELMGELPAGVSSNTITKFVKRFSKKATV